MKNKLQRIVVPGNIVVVLLSFFIFISGIMDVLSNSISRWDMKWTMSNKPSEEIIVVGIDDQSLGELGQFPWERDIYIPFIDKLEKAGATSIAFDILFGTASKDPEKDKLFAETLKKYDNIILPSQGTMEDKFGNYSRDEKTGLRNAYKLERPLPILDEASQNAHINALLDPDGVIRSTMLQINTPDGVVDSLAVKSMKLAGHNVDKFLNDNPKKELTIRYDALGSDFETVPFSAVLNGDIPDDAFTDRIVLVGFTAVGFENDDGITPVDRKMKLVYAHANIINQMLNDEIVHQVNDWVTLLAIAVMLLLTLYITWKLKPILSVVSVFAIVIALLIAQYFIFEAQTLLFDTVTPIAALLIAFLVNIAIKTYFEQKQRNYITKQFGRYISPDLVKEIAKNEQEIQLGGINKELSILFLDVRGFTTLSERMKPEEVVDFLNTMFNLITEKALDNKGTIDKFIGDAAMIIYNAPLDLMHHEYYAVKTAFDIQKGMVKVREEVFGKYEVNISCGIGINTGNVVVGNIGSYLRVDYTAIGDNVNTAARIESNTTANQVLVSEATYERTKDYFEYNYVGEKIFKGKTVPIKLYEVLNVLKAPE